MKAGLITGLDIKQYDGLMITSVLNALQCVDSLGFNQMHRCVKSTSANHKHFSFFSVFCYKTDLNVFYI